MTGTMTETSRYMELVERLEGLAYEDTYVALGKISKEQTDEWKAAQAIRELLSRVSELAYAMGPIAPSYEFVRHVCETGFIDPCHMVDVSMEAKDLVQIHTVLQKAREATGAAESPEKAS